MDELQSVLPGVFEMNRAHLSAPVKEETQGSGVGEEDSGQESEIKNYELRITNYELRITNYDLRITISTPRRFRNEQGAPECASECRNAGAGGKRKEAGARN